MAVTPECLGQHLTSTGNHTSQIENCMAISQKLLPKLPTEGFDLRDIVKEERGALYQNLITWQPTQGKRTAGRPTKMYVDQLQADTGYTTGEMESCMESRNLWRAILKSVR